MPLELDITLGSIVSLTVLPAVSGNTTSIGQRSDDDSGYEPRSD